VTRVLAVFVFAGVIVNAGRFLGRNRPGGCRSSDDGVDNVVVRLVELRLGEEWDEAFVAGRGPLTMKIFLAAITRHFSSVVFLGGA